MSSDSFNFDVMGIGMTTGANKHRILLLVHSKGICFGTYFKHFSVFCSVLNKHDFRFIYKCYSFVQLVSIKLLANNADRCLPVFRTFHKKHVFSVHLHCLFKTLY